MTPVERKLILDALNAVQDADGCLLGHPSGDQVSQAMGHHRTATKCLLQALGVWKGEGAA